VDGCHRHRRLSYRCLFGCLQGEVGVQPIGVDELELEAGFREPPERGAVEVREGPERVSGLGEADHCLRPEGGSPHLVDTAISSEQ
jgi:hypothetical protein